MSVGDLASGVPYTVIAVADLDDLHSRIAELEAEAKGSLTYEYVQPLRDQGEEGS